ncbi:MAG: hypothetical protein Q8O99_07965 [bacterium]|nr:hypothetical protein [bacterium]
MTDYKAQGFDTTSHERRRSLKESMPPHTPVGWDRANPEPPEVYTLLELEELIRQTERKMYDLEKVTTAGEDTLHHINPRNFSF